MMIVSSGAMWSEPVKEALLAHHPGMLLVDAFSSSEALGMGVSVSASGAAAKTASFTLGPDVKVLTEDGRPVEPGSDEVGVLALGGRNPLGYYKDEEKSDRTFKEIDGVRYSIPGDFAQVDADGTIHLLGPGLGLHQLGRREDLPRGGRGGAQDARCRARRRRGRGSRTRPTASRSWPWSSWPTARARPAEAELIDHVKERLARYKAPRRVRAVATIGRAPNGKVDYKRHRAESMDELGARPPDA